LSFSTLLLHVSSQGLVLRSQELFNFIDGV
jgi:hypothetical protein